ncbi:hypothetical protein SPRG_12210 [Saprolegnia parasitica CBS 223.65]|uniref:Uncharacterized protein n=1 Tax=Saprolegnia parasitica (strain CBS 223.65) TaxID=695850 RepID=A0A067C610_SAPPC|nr:hypothetical protein SPRG_12210 [Saprolegnia parasitica CBS 223.65]KDO22001.1 hypothetical protein SPRG_12210 [Saprolegnia parasitica CBS 223.65]|eukprot:XP_012207247.1 hypothetical protein SPRG_12210 [Saprolegnia parasitica CBS 223.65]
MTALRQLLSAACGWPTVRLSTHPSCDEMHWICAAMPIFNNVDIDGISLSERWKGGDLGFKTPFCSFPNKWASKMTALDGKASVDANMAGGNAEDRSMVCVS